MLCAITGEPLSAPNGYRMPTLPEPLGRSHAPWPRGHRRRLGRGLLAARGQILRAAGSQISPAENRPRPRLVLIDILVFDGLDEIDAWGPAEVFRSAGKRGSDMETRLVTRQARTRCWVRTGCASCLTESSSLGQPMCWWSPVEAGPRVMRQVPGARSNAVISCRSWVRHASRERQESGVHRPDLDRVARQLGVDPLGWAP